MSQPAPVGNDGPRIAERVIEDIRERMRRGVREYGVALQARNGRRALQDLYEELLDGAHYVRQRLDEEDLALAEATGDTQIRQTLSDIYDRVDVVRRNPGRISKGALEARYEGDIGRMRQVVESLLAEMVSARATPPPPPEGTEVARYQFRSCGPDGYVNEGDIPDVDAYPEGWRPGYWPEYRPLYGGQWYRVDPERPPEQPETSGYGPAAPEPPRDDGKAPDGLPRQD